MSDDLEIIGDDPRPWDSSLPEGYFFISVLQYWKPIASDNIKFSQSLQTHLQNQNRIRSTKLSFVPRDLGTLPCYARHFCVFDLAFMLTKERHLVEAC